MAERQNMADGVLTEAPQPAGEVAPGQGGVATLTKELSGNVPDNSRDVASPEARMRNWLHGRLEEPRQNDATTQVGSLAATAETEISSVARQQGPPTKRHGFTEAQVLANAELSDKERLEAVERLLGPLSDEQKDAFSRMHAVGLGKPSGGVYNYDQPNITEKARIGAEKTSTGQEVFTKEERSLLLESGLAGVLPASEIYLDRLALDRYGIDARLGPIAQQIRRTADAGGADENFFNRISARIERLQDEGSVDPNLANELLASLEFWRVNAAARAPERRIEQRQITSVFDNILTNIRDLQAQPPSPARDAALEAARQLRHDMRVEASQILLTRENGETYRLFDPVKDELFQTYYDARVEVTRKQKLSGDDSTRGRSKLQELAEMQQDPNSWEARRGFWSDPALEARFGGVVDDFYKESLAAIRAVVNNRNVVLGDLEAERLNQLWDYNWQWDPDEDRREMANFDAIRERVEKERKKRYWVSNRGDYESWIQLVADDLDEVEESIPFMLDYIRTKFQPNDPNKVFETVEQEKDKIVKALDKFGYERGYEIGSPEYRKVRRVKSRLGYEINLAGAEYFAKVLHESWDPYLKFMGTVARSFQDTETQDHFIDAILLDNNGMMMLAIDQFEANDGEYWRYGKNTAETQNNLQIGDAQKEQVRRREEILNILVNNELRPMEELLPNHPAFIRLKAQFDELDQEDLTAGRLLVDPYDPVDVNGNPKIKTRWQEYTEKALEWQGKRIIGDPRDKRQRVLFQHPLARALTNQEFGQMYRPIQRISGETDSQFNRRLREKKERTQTTIDTALRIATAFQQDAHAGLARHILTPAQKQELGLPLDDEAIPHNRLMKVMLGRAIQEDEAKAPKRQRFKLTHVLKKMGLSRDLPLFSNWRLGAHDDIRPGLLVNGINRVPELLELLREKEQVRALDKYDYLGGDFKTSISRMPEEEREFWEIMEVFGREKFPLYFNYPGHDTKGGGVKEMRNALLFPYGQSWDTVELSSLVQHMWLGEQAFLPAFGCSTWKQFVGQAKGGNEVVFQRMGGLFESPRDAEDWVKRIGTLNEESNLLTKGDEKRGGHGILNDGWGSGFHRWRDLNRSANFREAETQHKYRGSNGKLESINEYITITDPDAAYLEIDEKTYEAYVNLSLQFVAPLVSLFEARFKLETAFGRNPGTAKFLNTLTWYSCSNWMDRNWEEYRGKFGNALDVNLHMARKFIRTALYESGLMYYDDQWDQLMLGYTIPKEDTQNPDETISAGWERIQNTNWGSMTEEERKKHGPIRKVIRYGVNAAGQTLKYTEDHGRIKFEGGVEDGYVVEGILDAFPEEWRREIIERNNQPDKPWIIPMGLNTEYPEINGVIKQLKRHKENKGTRAVYEELLKPDQILRQTRSRKTIKRE